MKLKLIYFIIFFTILLASTALAGGLSISEMRFSVNYDDAYTYRLEFDNHRASYAFGLANNSKINADVLPGSNVTFTIRLANTFQGGFENDFRNAFSRIRIEEIDDGADLEDTSNDIDLDAGNDGLVDINFGIPVDVNSGTYNVVIEGEASGRNHTTYRTEVSLKLEVRKQAHDIRISKYQLIPSVVECSRKTKITASIINAGSSSENPVALEFKSDALKISSIDKDISLESSDDAALDEKTYTKTLNDEIPSSLSPGDYPITLNLYWKNTILFDQKQLELNVRDCGEKPSTIQNETKEIINPIQQENQPVQPADSNQASYFQSSGILFAFIGGLLAFIIIVVVILAYSRRK